MSTKVIGNIRGSGGAEEDDAGDADNISHYGSGTYCDIMGDRIQINTQDILVCSAKLA